MPIKSVAVGDGNKNVGEGNIAVGEGKLAVGAGKQKQRQAVQEFIAILFPEETVFPEESFMLSLRVFSIPDCGSGIPAYPPPQQVRLPVRFPFLFISAGTPTEQVTGVRIQSGPEKPDDKNATGPEEQKTNRYAE